MNIRCQFDDRLPIVETNFPPSVVQPGMSPSISQMVKTKKVGGNIDEFMMDGIEEDAPFESEYVDFFEAADLAQEFGSESKENPNTAPERQGAEQTPQDGGKPQNTDSQEVNS